MPGSLGRQEGRGCELAPVARSRNVAKRGFYDRPTEPNRLFTPQSSTCAFIDIQSLGAQTGIDVGGNLYVVSANPYVLTVDLPFSGNNVPFVNQGPAALDICLRPPNVDPWWGLGPGAA
jgi:hypothetical protein